MKNITLRVDEQILATVRRHALDRGTSVNRLVREFLAGIADREDRARKARARLRALSEESSTPREARSWRRQDLHER